MQYIAGNFYKHKDAINIFAKITLPLPDFWNKIEWYVRTSQGTPRLLGTDYIYMHPTVWQEVEELAPCETSNLKIVED